MTNSEFQRTAKIYQFPVRPRARAAGQLRADVRSSEIADAIDGAWYHQAAIREAKRAGER
jgi:Protein of unknown function (DUF2735)